MKSLKLKFQLGILYFHKFYKFSEKTGKLKSLQLNFSEYEVLSTVFSYANSNLKLKHLTIPILPSVIVTDDRQNDSYNYWKKLCEFVSKNSHLETLTLSETSNIQLLKRLVINFSFIF